MSPYKLSDSLDISIEEAKELFKKYEKAFPKLNKWLSEQGEFGKKNGYIVLNPIHKGRRWFPEFFDSQNSKDFKVLGSIERASMNTPIQGEQHCPV